MKKAIVLLLSCATILLLLSGCNSLLGRSPSKARIKSDLAKEDRVTASIGNEGHLSINKIKITLADTKDKVYTAKVTIYLENDVYSVQRTASVKYKKYDVGGWRLEDVSHIDTIDIQAIGAYPASSAIRNTDDKYKNVQLESHETDMENLIDVFTFSSSYDGPFFKYTVRFVDTYSGKNGTWDKTSSKVLEYTSELNPIDGLYYFGGSEEGHAIHFNNDSTITMLMEEPTEIPMDASRTKSYTAKPSYSFDPSSLTYSLRLSYYTFTIHQDKITHYNSTLREICFFEYKWLREDFYTTCVNFIREDQNRHADTNYNDPSSTIKKEELYGVWDTYYQNVLHYYFLISEGGVDYAFSANQLNHFVTLPQIDLLFYGYDPSQQAYIVYFCTRQYTTSSFYVSEVHSLRFVRETENGPIELRSYSHS